MVMLVLNINEKLVHLIFDAVSNTISSGKSSTNAMEGSTESPNNSKKTIPLVQLVINWPRNGSVS